MLKLSIYLFLLILALPMVIANFEYGIYPTSSSGIDLGVESFVHGESRIISYYITNTNSFCSMTCTSNVLSDSKVELPSSYFKSIADGDTVKGSFTVYAYSKSQANYQDSGTFYYELKVSCTTDPYPLFCPEGPETGNSPKAKITAQFDLSEEDKWIRDQLNLVLPTFKADIEVVRSELYELSSQWQKAKGKILIDYLQSGIQDIQSSFDTKKTIAEKIDDQFSRLDFTSALSSYNSLGRFDKSGFIDKISGYSKEITEVQKRHDSDIARLNVLKGLLFNLNEDASFIDETSEVFTLTQNYDALYNSISSLSFGSYEQLEASISSLESMSSQLQAEIEQKKGDFLSNLWDLLSKEYAKIHKSAPAPQSISLKNHVDSFCSQFSTTLPKEFQMFNQQEKQKIDELNDQRIAKNKDIESLNARYKVLKEILEKMKAMSAGKTIDKSLTEGCSASVSLINSETISSDYIEKSINDCQETLVQLNQSIEKNSKFIASVTNFFKYLFTNRPVLNQSEPPDFDSLKNEVPFQFVSINFDTETKNYVSQICNIKIEQLGIKSAISVGQISGDIFNGGSLVDFKVNEGTCSNNKCYELIESYPVLFVHGHLFDAKKDPLTDSIETFDGMIRYIAVKNPNFFDAGKIVSTGSKYLSDKSSKIPTAAMFRTTYYGQSYIDNSGQLVFVSSKYENIESYADKLKDIIDSTLSLSGRKKVKIVAHSMGGLVTREYLRKYGNSKVEIVIMIGTPNQGISGDIQANCAYNIGKGSEVECSDMSEGNPFIKRLSTVNNLPEKSYTISGLYKDNNSVGDAVVLKNSVVIPGITDYNFRSSKSNSAGYLWYVGDLLNIVSLVHNDLVDPNEMPQVADKVIELLNQ